MHPTQFCQKCIDHVTGPEVHLSVLTKQPSLLFRREILNLQQQISDARNAETRSLPSQVHSNITARHSYYPISCHNDHSALSTNQIFFGRIITRECHGFSYADRSSLNTVISPTHAQGHEKTKMLRHRISQLQHVRSQHVFEYPSFLIFQCTNPCIYSSHDQRLQAINSHFQSLTIVGKNARTISVAIDHRKD